jgi:hypothetical protein
VAQAFKDFLLNEGAALIAKIVPFRPPAASSAPADDDVAEVLRTA